MWALLLFFPETSHDAFQFLFGEERDAYFAVISTLADLYRRAERLAELLAHRTHLRGKMNFFEGWASTARARTARGNLLDALFYIACGQFVQFDILEQLFLYRRIFNAKQ